MKHQENQQEITSYISIKLMIRKVPKSYKSIVNRGKILKSSLRGKGEFNLILMCTAEKYAYQSLRFPNVKQTFEPEFVFSK